MDLGAALLGRQTTNDEVVDNGQAAGGFMASLMQQASENADPEEVLSSIIESSHEPYDINEFERVRPLGQGSFGQVFLAKRKGKERAVKQMNKNHIIQSGKLSAVQKEIQLLDQVCEHENIIEYYGSCQDEDNLYIILEYCPYGSLKDLIQKYKPLPIELIKVLVAQIVNALESSHEKVIVHRDLKPANILIGKQFKVKLTDFGESTQLDDPQSMYSQLDRSDLSEMEENEFVGTPLYACPEMIKSCVSSPAGDLWALGVIIYELFTGKTPFDAPTEWLLYEKIKSGQFDPSQVLDPVAADLIDKLLTLDPRQRLGAGQPNSGLDYAALKSHAFFSGLNFANVNTAEMLQNEALQKYMHDAENYSQLFSAQMNMSDIIGGSSSLVNNP